MEETQPVEAKATPTKLQRASAWLGRIPVIGFGWRRITDKEFRRNGIQITSLYGPIAAIDQIWINARMSLPEVIRTRVLATVLNLAGAGDVMAVGHRKWLQLWKVTPETVGIKRLAVEIPFMIAVDATWNLGLYALGQVATPNYFRSVGISTVVGVCVQTGVLRANVVLNDYATNDPKYRESISKRMSKAFGCERL